jgi:Lrp/AsnC family transcriptional regulator, leucine-responsive regulatory protein
MDIKLTKADNIILSNISHNPRILEKELARKCNLSKDSIRYRINRLEKLKVILGYGAFIDYSVLGYNSFKFYMRLNATVEEKEKLRLFLEKERNVFALFESHGNWDIAMVVFTKNRQEYYDLENKLLSEFGKLIVSRRFCSMLDAVILSNNLLHDNKKIEERNIWGASLIEDIDEKDKILINSLHSNSKESLVNLSEKVGLSIDAVSKRIKKLKIKKIIPFFTTDIDYNKLGFEKYKLFIYVKNYSPEIENKIFDFLKYKKNTVNIIRILGPWKLEVEFLIKEHSEFEKILSELQKEFSGTIQRLDFSIVRNETLFPSEKLLV